MLTEHESPRYDHHPMIPFVRERKKLAAYANIYQSFRKGLLLKRKVKFRLDHKLLIGKWAHATWEEWELPSHEYRRPNFDRCKSPMLTGCVSSISVIFQAPRKNVLLISMFFFFTLTLYPGSSSMSLGSMLLVDSEPDSSATRSLTESTKSLLSTSPELDELAASVAAVLQPYINTFFLREWPWKSQ